MPSLVLRTLVLLSLAVALSFLFSELTKRSSVTEDHMSSFKASYPNSLQHDELTSTKDFSGKQIVDKFAWLEDPTSESVKKWVDDQNEVTESYLAQLDFKKKLSDRYVYFSVLNLFFCSLPRFSITLYLIARSNCEYSLSNHEILIHSLLFTFFRLV